MAFTALTARAGLIALAPRVREAGSALLDLLLPGSCAACGAPRGSAEHELVCGACWLRAKELPRPRCGRCGHPLNVRRLASPCSWCTLLPPYVRAVRSAYALPGGTAESIVHAYKYQGWSAIGEAMARRMGALRFPYDVEQERAGLVPVPLAPSRLRERGYNQSELLAIGLGRVWNLPVRNDLLTRTRATKTQTRLTPGERQRNVANAFRSLADRGSLRGLHLV
ncbi:MAG: double zinc ribbon domain-containing protein, partial [Gemmatimonadaceae bacterium]